MRARFASRAGASQQHLVDDLSQRTWAAVWRALDLHTYDPARSALSTFIYAVAENIWRQHAKTASRAAARSAGTPLEPDLPGLTTGDGADPATATQLAEGLDLVRACLAGRQPPADPAARLSADDIQVLQLISRGVTDRALAEQLGLAPSTAHARKRAALAKLRLTLEAAERGRLPGESPSSGTLP